MGQVEKIGRVIGIHEGVAIVQSVGPLVMVAPDRGKAVDVSRRLAKQGKPGVAVDPSEAALLVATDRDLRGDMLVDLELFKSVFTDARLVGIRIKEE